jgi:PDZ domain-containing secreted protein
MRCIRRGGIFDFIESGGKQMLTRTLIITTLTIATLSGWNTARAQSSTTQQPTQRSDETINDASDKYADSDSPELGVIVGSCPGDAVCVIDTMMGSPADEAGIREGDYILMVDGQQVASPVELKQAIANHQPGDKVTVIFWRRGLEMTKEIQLASESKTLPPSHKAWLGVMLTSADDGGVAIDQVIPGGPAARAGLKVGDVVTKLNGVAIDNVDEFVKQVGDLLPDSKIELTVRRGAETESIAVKLGSIDDAPMRFLRRAFRPPMFHGPMLGDRLLDEGLLNPPFSSDPMLDEKLDQLRQQIRELQDKVRQSTQPQRSDQPPPENPTPDEPDGDDVSLRSIDINQRQAVLAQYRVKGDIRDRRRNNRWDNDGLQNRYQRNYRSYYPPVYRSPAFGNYYYRYGGQPYYYGGMYRGYFSPRGSVRIGPYFGVYWY